MKIVNSKDYEERKLNPDDVVVLRRYSKGLIITDIYKETFCLSNKKYDTENIFKGITYGNNMHYFTNGNRYINMGLIKNVKTKISPAATTYAVNVLFEGGKVETFNCSTEIEANSLKRKILQIKADLENSLEI